MICRSCGNQLPVDAQFCNVCGTKQEKSKSNTENECKKCGAKIIPGALFCNVCGSKISKEDDSHKCPKCGKQISGGMRFCAFCGFSINAEENQKANHEKQNSKNPIDHTYKRNTEEALDEAERLRKDIIYQQACAFIDKNTAEDLEAAVALFESISGWKDSDNKLIEALEEISRIEDEKREHNYSVLKKEMDEATIREQFVALSEKFADLGDYKDATSYSLKCKKIVAEYDRKEKCEREYVKALDDMSTAKSESDFAAIAKKFEELGDFKDSKKFQKKCQDNYIKIKEEKNEKEYLKAIATVENAKTKEDYVAVAKRFEALGDYKDSEEQSQKCYEIVRTKKKKQKKVIGIALSLVICIVAISIIAYKNRTREVDLSDTYTINAYGVDGFGRFTVEETKAPSSLVDKDEDEDIIKMLDNIDLSKAEDNDAQSSLSNGDKLTIEIPFNKKKAEELHVKIKGDKKSIKISGLKERYSDIKEIDSKLLASIKESAKEEAKTNAKKYFDKYKSSKLQGVYFFKENKDPADVKDEDTMPNDELVLFFELKGREYDGNTDRDEESDDTSGDGDYSSGGGISIHGKFYLPGNAPKKPKIEIQYCCIKVKDFFKDFDVEDFEDNVRWYDDFDSKSYKAAVKEEKKKVKETKSGSWTEVR